MLIDSGGKSQAYAMLDIVGSDRTNTQSGADATLRLTNGGLLRSNLSISGTTLLLTLRRRA